MEITHQIIEEVIAKEASARRDLGAIFLAREMRTLGSVQRGSAMTIA